MGVELDYKTQNVIRSNFAVRRVLNRISTVISIESVSIIDSKALFFLKNLFGAIAKLRLLGNNNVSPG